MIEYKNLNRYRIPKGKVMFRS